MNPRLRKLRGGACGAALLAALVLPWADPAAAQGPARRATPADPLDPAAAVPAASYRSPFSGHRRHAEQPVAPWREANDTVRRIGGWRTYAREGAASAAAPAIVPAAAPATPSATSSAAPPATRPAASAPHRHGAPR